MLMMIIDYRSALASLPPNTKSSLPGCCCSALGARGVTRVRVYACSQREEWKAALPQVRRAGQTWANSLALRSAKEEDFDDIDRNHGGFIDLQEFCEWVEAAEKLAGTSQGMELGVNEPIDRASVKGRQWHTSPLEMRARHQPPPPGGRTTQPPTREFAQPQGRASSHPPDVWRSESEPSDADAFLAAYSGQGRPPPAPNSAEAFLAYSGQGHDAAATGAREEWG